MLSALTDVIDGRIARKFNMVSDLGKIIDPIADKFTEGILLLCLINKYPLMLAVIIIFILYEAFMLIAGFMIFKRHDKLNSAKWYGKVCTVILYAVCILLIVIPSVPKIVADCMCGLCIAAIILAFILYGKFYLSQLKKN